MSWLSTILSIFSGNILVNLLLNEPVVSSFGNTQQVLWASLIWYLAYYSPFDLAYKLINIPPIRFTLLCTEEVHNCKVIYQSIVHASRIFPDSYVIMAFVGICKGNGPCFIRILESFLRGAWPTNYQYSTKITILVTLVFIVNRFSEWLMITQPFILFCVASSCIYLRTSAALMDLTDPFGPIENLICLIFFGGIWDALSRALTIEESLHHNRGAYSRPIKSDSLIGKVQRTEAKLIPVRQTASYISQSETLTDN